MRLGFPDAIKIGGLTYTCRYPNDITRDRNHMGESNASALWIDVDSTLPLQQRESTLLHEIIEQVGYIYELGLEHRQIMSLEAALYQVLQDNPNVFGTGVSETRDS
jgi:hypothetical protein